MITLRIEHAVPDFVVWKKAFDNDPLNRPQSGVRRHHIVRPTDDPLYLIVDLDFDDAAAANAFLARLRELWRKVDVMREPKARILETVERAEY
jgi:hypothetical protein